MFVSCNPDTMATFTTSQRYCSSANFTSHLAGHSKIFWPVIILQKKLFWLIISPKSPPTLKIDPAVSSAYQVKRIILPTPPQEYYKRKQKRCEGKWQRIVFVIEELNSYLSRNNKVDEIPDVQFLSSVVTFNRAPTLKILRENPVMVS